MAEQNTAWLLTQWALWKNECAEGNLGFGGSMYQVSSDRERSVIADADAVRVDRVLAELRLHNKTWRKVLDWAFIFEYGDRVVAARLGVTRYAAAKLYEEAYCWVDDALQKIIADAA